MSSFPGNDYAYVNVGSDDTPIGAVNNYSGGTVNVAGSTQAAVGSTVCRSGSTTGWHCGTIQAFNASVTYAEGTVSGLIRTNVCAEPGDSGGSLLAGTQAQGMTSGGSGNCSSGGAGRQPGYHSDRSRNVRSMAAVTRSRENSRSSHRKRTMPSRSGSACRTSKSSVTLGRRKI